MENDVLKNRIAPWQEKGRWYHAQLQLKADKSGFELIPEQSDSYFNGFSFSSASFQIGQPGDVVTDYKFLITHCEWEAGAPSYTEWNIRMRIYTSLQDALFLYVQGPTLTNFADLIYELYVFAYKK